MMTQETIQAIKDAKFNYEAAVARGSGVSVAKETLKNLLYSHLNDFLKIYEENKELQEEVDALDAALKDAEEEAKAKKKPPVKKPQETGA